MKDRLMIRMQQRHETSNKLSETNPILYEGEIVYESDTNPILHEGEIVYESDTKKIKIGDGKTKYTELSYFGSEEFEKMKEEIEKIKHDMYILFAASYIAPIVYLFIIGIIKIISSL